MTRSTAQALDPPCAELRLHTPGIVPAATACLAASVSYSLGCEALRRNYVLLCRAGGAGLRIGSMQTKARQTPGYLRRASLGSSH